MSNGISMPQGTRMPDDVKQKVDDYNQRITKQDDKIERDWGPIDKPMQEGRAQFDQKIADLININHDYAAAADRARQLGYTDEAAGLDQMAKDVADLKKLQNSAYNDVIDTWKQDLQQAGVKVPANLGSGDEALNNLASLQYGVDLEKRSANLNLYQGSITAQLMSAWLDRTNLLDKSLSSQLKDMQDKNKLLADANNVMSDLRSARPADSDDKKQVPSGIVTWAREHGVSVPDGVANGDKVKQAVWDQFIQNIKSYVDNNNNDSQLMMVRLQDIQQKRDNAFELVSNLVKKLGSVDEQIISGMR